MNSNYNKTTISVCIPTYEMHGKGSILLKRNFNMLLGQTFKNFEVIVTDNSPDDIIKNLCKDPNYKALNVKYIRNPKRGISPNTNEAIKQSTGELIKILYMDDYLTNKNSLQDIVDSFKGYWLVTGCGHDTGNGKIRDMHLPTWNKKLYLGKNTIGSPSVLTIKNENPPLFDENLTWTLDCDYYQRLYDQHGEPTILNKINVIIGKGKHQTTNHLNYLIKKNEYKYMRKKYATKQEKNKILKIFKFW